MKSSIQRIFLVKLIIIVSLTLGPSFLLSKAVDWLVVGAGPAGITSIAVLIQQGIKPETIAWVDPLFNVGRLSSYKNVPANTTQKAFIDFLEMTPSMRLACVNEIIAMKAQDALAFPCLEAIINPLQIVTEYLKKQVHLYNGTLTTLDKGKTYWYATIDTHDSFLAARHVILATGSRPRSLDYDERKEIPLDQALDPQVFQPMISADDTVAVVGSAHSAVLVLKYLTEIPVKKIIHFYKNPFVYATEMGGWTLHAHIGLKGPAAHWAREVLEKNPPANLETMLSSPEVLREIIPTCTKVVYAIGFEPNPFPLIAGCDIPTYDDTTGYIDTRLYGIGIAFPEKTIDPLGNVEYRVGVNSFIDYAQRIIPQWIAQDRSQAILGRKCYKVKPTIIENY